MFSDYVAAHSVFEFVVVNCVCVCINVEALCMFFSITSNAVCVDAYTLFVMLVLYRNITKNSSFFKPISCERFSCLVLYLLVSVISSVYG